MTISGSSDSFGGYLADVCLIDGTQYAASDFGEFDEDSPTSWKPKDIPGLTFGTNGFLLDFSDSAALGDDVSGNSNDYAVTNLAATDQMTDTPTNNYPVLNPLYKNGLVYSEGNLHGTIAASAFESGIGTFGATKGKWYCELKITALAGSDIRNSVGIVAAEDCSGSQNMASEELGYSANSIGRQGISSGSVHKDSSNVGGTFGAYAVGDVLAIAMDLDNGKWYVAKDNVWENSGDPESGATGTGAITIDDITSGFTYMFGNTVYGGSAWDMNFGNPPYANTSDAADANGYGRFEYAPPSGYYAMNTKNLAEYG